MTEMSWELKKIIDVCRSLRKDGYSHCSTGELIAAAFVLNEPKFLPRDYTDLVEAWDRLGGTWQEFVRDIKAGYMDQVYK